MTKLRVVLVLAALVLGLSGCKKESPAPPPAAVPPSAPQAQTPPPAAGVVSVVNISLGKALGPDKKIATATDAFAKGDTIYAVVETTGSGKATLKARWAYHKGDKTASVSEDSKTISANGPEATEFHVSKPDGWPLGDYQVEISFDDKSVGTKKFVVK